jgi:hypothetical protein
MVTKQDGTLLGHSLRLRLYNIAIDTVTKSL